MPTEFANAITKSFQTFAVLLTFRSRQSGQRLPFCKGLFTIVLHELDTVLSGLCLWICAKRKEI